MKRYEYELVGFNYRIFDTKNSGYTMARCGNVTDADHIVDALNTVLDLTTAKKSAA